MSIQKQMQIQKRHCPTCNDTVEPIVRDTDQQSYHGDDTSVVVCPDCNKQLGHLTWWPDKPDSLTYTAAEPTIYTEPHE